MYIGCDIETRCSGKPAVTQWCHPSTMYPQPPHTPSASSYPPTPTHPTCNHMYYVGKQACIQTGGKDDRYEGPGRREVTQNIIKMISMLVHKDRLRSIFLMHSHFLSTMDVLSYFSHNSTPTPFFLCLTSSNYFFFFAPHPTVCLTPMTL